MKLQTTAIAAIAFSSVACAQSPTPPETPDTPNVTTVTEDCGEGCSRTITKIVSSAAGEDGSEIYKKDIEVIELVTGDQEDVSVDVDVEEHSDGEGIVRKKVKVIAATDGEITPEMRAKIDEMISNIEGEEGQWHQKGDGVMVFNSTEDSQKVRVILREDGQEFVTGDPSVDVEQIENADGSRTIRVTPEDGGETTVITIKKEKSSKSDN